METGLKKRMYKTYNKKKINNKLLWKVHDLPPNLFACQLRVKGLNPFLCGYAGQTDQIPCPNSVIITS